MKLWWHKMKHWEYWSVNIVYLPTFFLWLWYMIKFRSFKFYQYSNPGIKNGGLHGDSKMHIYQLLPRHLYPKTVYVERIKPTNLSDILIQNQLHLPVIVKPDIGCRGVGVMKINNIEELIVYGKGNAENYLIQELIDLPNEIGLFYCRIPNQTKGIITGITIKNFLTIVGNGKETIEQLLMKNPRFEMQIPKLKDKINLFEILPAGKKECLVPYGNHNRGTEFLDGNEYITEKLEQTFDEILSQVRGFYFGRLDIRYNTFEELEQGINFSIIELNGAKSEPTHIYDTKHSFWYGQREIFRHQKILKQIIKENVQRLTQAKTNNGFKGLLKKLNYGKDVLMQLR